MVELCLMSSSSLPGLVLQQERSLFGAFDDCLPLLRNHCAREETILSTSLSLKPLQLEASWSPVAGLSDSSKYISVDSAIARHVVIDHHESRSNPILLGYGIAEKCTRREEVMQFLASRSNEVEESMLNPSLLSDLMGLQPPTSNLQQSPTAPFDYVSSQNDTDADTWSSLVYPTGFLLTEKPLLDFVGDLARDSKLIFGLDGLVLFNGTGSEMKDLLSFVVEFYLSKNPTSLRKQSVVPYFHRRASKAARGAATVKTPTVTSPEKVNLKPSTDKSSNKAVKGKNSYEKDYFRACEILLSLMMNKKRQDKTLLLLLKKSGPELGELLTQCSASIAGTGVAIIISVVCKLVCARVPMCGSKIVSSGLGLGLVWLSWAVNRLRDDIVQVSKNPSKVSSGKVSSGEEDLMRRVDKDVNDIFVSAATLMAVALLRLA